MAKSHVYTQGADGNFVPAVTFTDLKGKTKKLTAAAVRLRGKTATKRLNNARAIAAAHRQEARIAAGGKPLIAGGRNRTVIHGAGGPTVVNSES